MTASDRVFGPYGRGRVALVTDVSNRIGAAIATALAECGATVVVNSASSVAAGR